MRLSTTGSGVNVGVSVGRGVRVNVSVGIGVNVSGMVVAVKISVGAMLVGDDSTSGEEEAGAVPPVTLQERVVRTRNIGSNIFFIS